MAGLWRDKTRPPGWAPISKEKVAEVVQTAMAPPPEHASHWTLKALARETGVAMSGVRTICADTGCAPIGCRPSRSLATRPLPRRSVMLSVCM